MHPLLVLALAWIAAVSAGWFIVVPWLRRGPGGCAKKGMLWYVARVYCRVWHRARYFGIEILPRDEDHGGLIVVANHTGAVDPLLVQVPCRFFIRWMMASDMLTDGLGWLWRQADVIPVDRENSDSRSLREAIRHVRAGNALGIFPEGRITIPPREVRPFLPGIGVIIKRTKAPVLLVWVRGTPDTNRMGEALATRSNAEATFLDLIDYRDEVDPNAIANDLRRRVHEASDWPYNDAVIPPGGE